MNGSQEAFPANEVSRLYVDAGVGDDTITDTVYFPMRVIPTRVSQRVFPTTLLGGDGNDTISGGDSESLTSGSPKVIDGGDGNNYLVGGHGFNSIRGGAGNDTIVSNGNDTIIGGDGNDVITVKGGGDSIDAGAGDDIIYCNGGNNTITCGDGNDIVDYGNAPGYVDYRGVEAGIGVVVGAEPNEFIDFRPALSVTVYGPGTSGTDLFTDLPETIAGSEYGDSFDVRRAAHEVTLLGRGGDDSFDNSGGPNVSINTTAVAGVHELGGAGKDQFLHVGNGFPQAINGGGGNDTFVLDSSFTSAAPVTLNGGPGRDSLNLEDTPAGTYDLNAYISIENVLNVKNGSRIIGNAAANYIARAADASTDGATILGNGGNDTLIGGPGPDYLSGGSGNDLIEGGGGADTIFGGDGNDVLAGNSGNDKIHGGAGNDTIVGGSGRDRLYGDDGDDLLLALDHQRDTVYGGSGTDTASVDDSAKVKDLWDQIETFL